MAVEAHHLHLSPSQLLRNREIISAIENQSGMHNIQMGFVAPVSSGSPFIPFYNSAAPNTAATVSESGLTFNTASAAATVSLPRKRSREPDCPLSFLGDDISSHTHHQLLDIDRLIVHHVEKVRAELMERRSRFSRQILAAVEQGVAKRLKAKEDEIERIGKLNWALEERIKSLCVENQIWRDLAQTNEATANVLRTNLEQVLAAQIRLRDDNNGADADAAESCCCGDNGEDPQDAAPRAAEWRRTCRSCRENEPSVLLLPCRHLCVCAACAPAIDACPLCECGKDGTVNVNMS